MKITLEKLKELVAEQLGTWGTAGTGADNHAFVKKGTPSKSDKTEPSVNVGELGDLIRALIGGDADFPIGEWGDEALNDAAHAAAAALVYSTSKDGIQGNVRMYEEYILEEIEKIAEENELDFSELSMLMKKMIEKLDSIDMSLDLVYGSLAGISSPISGIRLKQKYFGRAVGAKQPKE